MISKNKLKELAAYRQQRRCDEEAVFVVEGPKMCAEALASSFNIRVVCATEEWRVESGEWRTESGERRVESEEWRTESGERRVENGEWRTESGEFYEVSQAELERLSNMRSPNQVWMLVERPANFSLLTSHSSLILALDRIQDPGNMGTIMRTADWYGIRHIVCSSDTVSCYNPKVVQASMGAIFRTCVEYVDLPQWLADCGMTVFGATLNGEPLTPGAELVSEDHPAVLLIGNEGRGISDEALTAVTRPVTIGNIGGTAESLNASVAAAILIDRLIG